ncbi:MAG: hypothetical protein FD170_3977 [Bacteroidetes bacterium]|nr:MAG: hypothetical protein FD170_3977 [Bacteroidota bacterium]
MGEITIYTNNLPAAESIGGIPSKLGDISRLFRKVKITLSDGQYKALFHLISFWLNKDTAKGYVFVKLEKVNETTVKI